MPFDNSIYGRKMGMPDLAGNFQKGLTMAQMIEDSNKRKKTQEEQDAVKGIFSKNINKGDDGKISLNRDATLSELASINPELALKYQKQFNADDELAIQKQNALEDRALDRRYKNAQINKMGRENLPGQNLSEAQKTFDKESAKNLAEYSTGGGKQTVNKNLARFQSAIDRLSEKDDLTGGFSTKVPWFGDDNQQDWINPDMASVRDDIRSAIQGSLKATLGAQFTEKEAEQIFSRAFNPRLSDDENIRRAKLELASLQDMASNKDAANKYFRERGTLAGYKPQDGGNYMQIMNERGNGGGGLDIPGISKAYAQDPKKAYEKIKGMSREDKIKLLKGN